MKFFPITINSFVILLLFLSSNAVAGECKDLINNLSQMDNIAQLQQALHCLDKAAETKLKAGETLKRAKVKHRTHMDKYMFELSDCSRHNNKVNCTIFITNQNAKSEKPTPQSFGIFGQNTSFHDETGSEYNVDSITIGNSLLAINQSNRQASQLQKFMPLQIPIKTILSFSDIPTNVTTVRALNISFRYSRNTGDEASRILTLQNVAIVKDESTN